MKRVLLVEDSELIRNIVCDALQTCFPCVTTVAEDGGQAWEKLNSNTYDLLITDIIMPVMDGITLAQKVREELASNIPIVMMTSISEKRVRESASAAGADAYVTKPVDYHELIQVVENLVLPESSPDEEEPLLLDETLEEDQESR
jgi:CheY-like chemotaxis protein